MPLRAWVLLAALPACSGEKTDTASSGDTASAPTFAAVRDQVLLPSCALGGCHSATDQNGMALPAGGEYAALVNVESTFAPGQFFVVPGDADGSYLVLKMEDAVGITGGAMPPPMGALDPDLKQLVRAWIDAGANP
jgi:hypothetical protein